MNSPLYGLNDEGCRVWRTTPPCYREEESENTSDCILRSLFFSGFEEVNQPLFAVDTEEQLELLIDLLFQFFPRFALQGFDGILDLLGVILLLVVRDRQIAIEIGDELGFQMIFQSPLFEPFSAETTTSLSHGKELPAAIIRPFAAQFPLPEGEEQKPRDESANMSEEGDPSHTPHGQAWQPVKQL